MENALDISRVATAVAGVALVIVLLWRAGRWIGKFREPAYLHLAAAILSGAASMNALDHLGDGVTRFTAFNIGGIALGWIFITKTPAEKTFSWKELRGDPPDWDSLTGGIHREPHTGPGGGFSH